MTQNENKTEMQENENNHFVCAANCPLNRIVTVHEIGRREGTYRNSHLECFDVPWHFVEYKNVRNRHFLLHAIKEIGGFDLPVFEFQEKEPPGFLGWLGDSTIECKKVKDMSGGWVRLDNGETILVSETCEELKKLIEGETKEE